MPSEQSFNVAAFADDLARMSDTQLFATLQLLDEETADIPPGRAGERDVFAKIALVERAIEHRYPGQLLAPYKKWQRHQSDI